jgi:aspartate/methionine/tyrosine aminotransferase
MSYAVNPSISQIEAPPIAEAMTWVRPGLRNRDLLNLCQAVPSYPPAPEMQAEIARLAGEPSTSLYTGIFGIDDLRTSLAAHMAADYAGNVQAEDTAITAGCNQAFCATMMALARAGDNVVMPVPYYFNHQMWLGMLGVESRGIPAFTADGAYPQVAAAAAAIDDRTKAIILCSPNNPSGAIYPPEVIGAFFDLAKARGVALIIDETYKDFRPHPAPLHGLFARADWRGTFIQLYSFSKIFAMTGYRAGSIIAGPQVMAEIEKVLDCMAICAPHISQRAALFGLAHLDAWKSGKKAMMLARTEALKQAFLAPALRYRLVSCGAYFAYVEHPFANETAKQVAQRLAGEHDLLCLPGTMFGQDQQRFLRIAFANADASLMPLAVERLIESQARL